MHFIYPEWDAPPNIGALSTTRRGGVSMAPYGDGMGGGGLNLGAHAGDCRHGVEHNRSLLRAAIPVLPVWLSQVHGTAVLDAVNVKNAAVQSVQADACIATQGGVACAILTADCLPVLLCDALGRTVGAAHAGWRGLAGGILENTVSRMRDAGAEDILAWLGPAIGPACFEVGTDVLAAFGDRQPKALDAFQAIAGRPGKYLADIYALARMRLQSAGVRRIYGGVFCTVSEQRFYSYRRDGVTGRMASLIWIDEKHIAK
ncbi:MAG: peptidoglycan editing factor PgeF [Burkholderiales bacterium]